MDQAAFRQLVSGRTTGLSATLMRLILSLLAPCYTTTITLRNLLYDKGLLKTHSTTVPVISIGNITTGGTGKTPLVIWITNFLHQKNLKTAVITRGYKSNNNLSDEPAVITSNCPQTTLIINSDRVTATTQAVNTYNVQTIVLDDGFQHRRLARDIDIITINATEPFGFGKTLPAGLLREPVDSLRRANAAVITHSDKVDIKTLAKIEAKLRLINPEMLIAKSIHKTTYAKTLTGEQIPLNQLSDKKIFAFCGIANPNAFFDTLKNLPTNIVGTKIYDDHNSYTDTDITAITKKASAVNADLILTTEKDKTKLNITPNTPEIAYLAIEIHFTANEDKLKQLIESALQGKIITNSQ